MEKKLIIVLFGFYCIYLFNLTLIRPEGVIYQSYNLELFKNLIMIYCNSKTTFFYLFLGNIFVFIPLGLFYRYLFKFGFFKTIVAVFLTSLIIEISQLVLKVGVFELDDLILNTLGGIIGCVIYLLVERMKKNV